MRADVICARRAPNESMLSASRRRVPLSRISTITRSLADTSERLAGEAPCRGNPDAPLGQGPLQRLTDGAYRVTPNEVWLLSNYDPRSFDSRYFGPVPAANVLGVAHPVWVLR